MSAAIWIAAKRRSARWRRIWPQWRNRKAPLHAQGSPALSGRPLALIGSYDCAEGIDRAAREFHAAAFSEQDAVFVQSSRRVEKGMFIRILDWPRRWLSREARATASDFTVPITGRAAQSLLNSGGGFVLVNNAARFHEACEIIERTGGRVGCIAADRQPYGLCQR